MIRDRRTCWSRLKPDDVHKGDHRHTETHSFCAQMGGENLSQIRELSAIQADSVEDLEDEEHCNSSLQSAGVIGRHKVGDQGSFYNQGGHTSCHSECDELGTREAVHERHGGHVHTQSKGQPCGGIQELFGGREVELSV